MKARLLSEFENRITSFNEGGVTKTKIITSYRERAIKIAYYLKESPKTVKEIKLLTSDDKCNTILQKNYYLWFERIERGIYQLTDIGKTDLCKYDFILNKII